MEAHGLKHSMHGMYSRNGMWGESPCASDLGPICDDKEWHTEQGCPLDEFNAALDKVFGGNAAATVKEPA